MHDLDRIMTEMEPEGSGYQYGETGPYSYPVAGEGPLSEADEMELAEELLSISNEDELDQFLGNVFKKVGRAAGRFVRSPIGRSLGGILKGVARKALPTLGGALGSMIPIPGVGTAVGTALGTAASKLFEMELEGMELEDQEFEVARRMVRLAGEAAKNAAVAPSGSSPQAVARAAVIAAAQKHAPGLLGGPPAPSGSQLSPVGSQSGKWIRRGRKIILLGV
jgi:uncharacterized protein (DUF697 family)